MSGYVGDVLSVQFAVSSLSVALVAVGRAIQGKLGTHTVKQLALCASVVGMVNGIVGVIAGLFGLYFVAPLPSLDEKQKEIRGQSLCLFTCSAALTVISVVAFGVISN